MGLTLTGGPRRVLELGVAYSPQGNLPTPIRLFGTTEGLVSGLVASEAVVRELGNQHLHIEVNSLTGSGVVVVAGDSVSEEPGLPIVGDSENVTVDAIGGYQTQKKWWQTTSVTIPAGITAINYDLSNEGYWDYDNRNFTLLGYRMEITPRVGATRSLRLRIIKHQDDGNKKASQRLVEDITIDNQTGITDNLRTGGDDRSLAVTMFGDIDRQYVLKMGDFDTFYTTDEQFVEAGAKAEGVSAIIDWANIDYFSFVLRFIPTAPSN